MTSIIRRSTWLVVVALGSSSLGCGSDDLDKPQGQAGSGTSGGSQASGAGGTGATSGAGARAGVGGTTGNDGSGGQQNGSGAGAGRGGASNGGASGGGSGAPVQGGAGASSDGTCETVTDCGDLQNTICDPLEGKCKPVECDDTTACEGENDLCIPQAQAANGGACYEGCTPFGEPCSGDQECFAIELDNSLGICLPRGKGTEGAECEPTSTSTGCGEGLLCAGDELSGACRAACDFFGTGPTCVSEQRCSPFGICDVPSIMADAAAVDEACSASAEEIDPCADDGKKFGGVCLELEAGASMTCSQLCSTTLNECGAPSQACAPFQDVPELGVCLDQGACGDGGQEYNDCDACLTAESDVDGCCEGIATACQNEPDCGNFGACLQDCENPTEACIGSCIDDYPNGVQLFTGFVQCTTGLSSFVGACGTVCQ